MAKKSDALVKELAGLYGNRFADVLNALWLRGIPAAELTRAVSTSGTGTNDATDIVARLLNAGIRPEDIRESVGTPAPPGTQFAFVNTGDKARIVAHTNPPTGATPAGPSETGNILAFVGGQPAPAPYVPAPVPAAPTSAAGGGGGAGYGGGQTPAAIPQPRPLTPDEIRGQIQAQYGWAAALADVPEVAAILNDAANGRISAAEVGNRFRATSYYRTTTEAQRNWQVFERTDPADAARRRDAQRAAIASQATKLGLDPNNPRLQQIADLTLRYGWNDQQVAQALASEVRYDPTGQQRGVFAELGRLAREYVLTLSSPTMNAWASRIVAGTQTLEDFEGYARDQAKSLYQGMAGALDTMTVRQYVEPYAQDTAKVLGMNPEDIDWTNPKWMRAINQLDEKGNRTVMSRADWQRTLMADPEYGFDDTANGKAAQAGLARQLLQKFGFASAGGA